MFYRRMEGRYLSIVATQYKTDAMVMEYFLKMIVFNIFPQCGDDINGKYFKHASNMFLLTHGFKFVTYFNDFKTLPKLIINFFSPSN